AVNHGLGDVPALDALAGPDAAGPGPGLGHDLLSAPLAAARAERLEVQADPHLHRVKLESLAKLLLDPEPFGNRLQAKPVGAPDGLALGGAGAVALLDVLHQVVATVAGPQRGRDHWRRLVPGRDLNPADAVKVPAQF